ncbi:PepSY-associated TM helix domain-containing protein [Silvibacterium dinghuense]|uniref:PepSY domain-containing protein n=1 Tax=Silvibacterium dinghuense TaxID=1560006 RepID=A0A4Q1S8Y0_9BACT|nr:PepSY-associated TM helix domain-containing protein [Silvibacterium dinghuense]RXS93349.1 PepSY domain-containing protein [Silvibacterium dinghuense]GGH05096.1 hypothetical protein GCM10011586_21530 [Silvibacterium dinghuense]
MLTTMEERTSQPAHHAHTGWLYAPQRTWLRRALFQIHLWVGIVLTLYAIAIGLSGSAIVFQDEINRSLHPQISHIAPAPQRMPLAAIIRQVETTHPGWTASSLLDIGKSTQATSILLHPIAQASNGDYRLVSVNPYTGAVLGDAMRYSGVLGWLSNLHYTLLAGPVGLKINGWMAIGLFLLCLTGLVLWWPGVRRWTAALVLRRRKSWRRVNWDLHTVIGFWACAALLLVTFTGIYFVFPEPVSTLVIRATGGSPAETKESLPASRAAVPANTPVMDIDAAIRYVDTLLPKNAPLGYMTIPTGKNPVYNATGYYTGAAPYSKMVSISFDGRTGAILEKSDTHDQVLGRRIIQYFFTLHFGSFGGDGALGIAVKILWVLLGLVPALLAVTGVLMYWNRKLRPRLRRS